MQVHLNKDGCHGGHDTTVLQLYPLIAQIYPRAAQVRKLYFCIQTKNNIYNLYQPCIGLYLFYKCIFFLFEVGSHFHHIIKYIQKKNSKIFIYLNMFHVNNIQYVYPDYLHLTIIYKSFFMQFFFTSEILPKKLGPFSCDRIVAIWRQCCQ